VLYAQRVGAQSTRDDSPRGAGTSLTAKLHEEHAVFLLSCGPGSERESPASALSLLSFHGHPPLWTQLHNKCTPTLLRVHNETPEGIRTKNAAKKTATDAQ
jgi:hypothetical protein